MRLADRVRDSFRSLQDAVVGRRGNGIVRQPSRPCAIRPWRSGETEVPIICITPDDGDYVHTFFDVCPFSPSQRFVAVTRLPFGRREPRPGDLAEVCVIDLEARRIRTVYRTRAWGLQLGANLNWGATDRTLFSNDLVDGKAVCVEIDLQTGEARVLSGPMYHIAPDASSIVGFPLDLINATQRGYGVPVKRSWSPTMDADYIRQQGLWMTRVDTDESWLLVSIAALLEKVPEPERESKGAYFLFHSKFNRQGTRIMQVLRCLVPGGKGKHPQLFTFDADGENIRRVLSTSQWDKGHHPSWHPDGEHLIQNIPLDGVMRFCQFRYDGSGFRALSERLVGTGHPSISGDGRYIITDAKPKEAADFAGGDVPIRWIDLAADEERVLCKMPVIWPRNRALRLDPHPAWSRDHRLVCFNGAPLGRRQVFIADLTNEFAQAT